MEKIIMYDSDEAAVYETRSVTGWWSRTGTFYGENEDTARYMGCTHEECKKHGIVISKRGWCPECLAEKDKETWSKLPEVEWDGKSLICLHDGEQYFYDRESLMDYCKNNNFLPQNLMLVEAEPVDARMLDEDYWQDDVAEDGELPDAMLKAIDELNKVVKKCGPLSWVPGKKRINAISAKERCDGCK